MGARLDIPGLTLSDLKFRILGVFMQPFPGYAGGIQYFNLEHWKLDHLWSCMCSGSS